jgi:hypothetical protein
MRSSPSATKPPSPSQPSTSGYELYETRPSAGAANVCPIPECTGLP